MDEPRPGHRLDDGRDRLGVDLVDPAGEPPQRIDVGGTTSWSRCSPRSESGQISSFLRLRSSPACNIALGLLGAFRYMDD